MAEFCYLFGIFYYYPPVDVCDDGNIPNSTRIENLSQLLSGGSQPNSVHSPETENEASENKNIKCRLSLNEITSTPKLFRIDFRFADTKNARNISLFGFGYCLYLYYLWIGSKIPIAPKTTFV